MRDTYDTGRWAIPRLSECWVISAAVHDLIQRVPVWVSDRRHRLSPGSQHEQPGANDPRGTPPDGLDLGAGRCSLWRPLQPARTCQQTRQDRWSQLGTGPGLRRASSSVPRMGIYHQAESVSGCGRMLCSMLLVGRPAGAVRSVSGMTPSCRMSAQTLVAPQWKVGTPGGIFSADGVREDFSTTSRT
jgi:hypothetical protein